MTQDRIRLTKTVQVGKNPFNTQRNGTVLTVTDDPTEATHITPGDAKAFKAMGYAKDYTAEDAKPDTKNEGKAPENKDKGSAPQNKGNKGS